MTGASSGPGSREPSPDGLGPTGFDPSRVYRSEPYPMITVDEGRDGDGAPLREVWAFANEDTGSGEGDGFLELRIREVIQTERSGTIVVYYRQWFAPDGNPAFGMRPKRRVGSLASVKALIKRRKMTLCDSDGSGEAGETGTGSTEGDSAGPEGIAQTPTSRNPNP
jgi:hypothetical protein